MESWYFTESRCGEKEKDILKEVKAYRISKAFKKRNLNRFYFLLNKLGIFLLKIIFYFRRKKRIGIE